MPSAPYILNIEPLYYCNLDCPLCDRQIFPLARKQDAGRLPRKIIDKIFQEVGDYLVHKHNIHEVEEAQRIAEELNVIIRFAPLRGME